MKIRILLSAMAFCLLCNCGIARAQNSGAGSKPLTAPDNTLFLELGPASNGIGVGYERRLLKSAQLYLRTGLGFGFSTDDALYQSAGSNNWSQGDCHTYSYTVPVGATYLLWDHRSKLELGAGAAFTYQHSSVEGYNKDDSFGANLYGNVGWRWQARSGFLLRMGLSPIYSLNKDNVWNNGVTIGNHDKRCVLGFYLGLGWAF